MERVQRRRLRDAVSRAYRHVPYYRETMGRIGLTPDDFRRADDLVKLPLIEREQLQRDPEYFVARDYPLGRYMRSRSGGSSGVPITIFRHPFSLFAGAVHRERLRKTVLQLAGRRVRIREALIALPESYGTGAAFDRWTLLPSSVRVVRARLSLLTPPSEMVPALNEFKPDVIATYGSYLEALFSHLDRAGEDFHRPRVVVFSSDGITDSARRLIQERFGIPVLGAYRTIEAPQIGFECERHRGYHLNIDLCPVRIVDADGRELRAGESGEVAVSNLFTRGTVLLNYRLGDVAARLPDRCDCGRSLPLLSYIQGRAHEWVRAPSGEPVHGQAIRSLMREIEAVLRYQVTQEAPGRFQAALVTSRGSDQAAVAQALEHGFAERFGRSTAVESAFVEELPKTASGKVKPVVGLADPTVETPVPGQR